MKQPIKMTPGDELHLTALMAPFSLNLVTGQDRQHLLGYGRAAFEAGQKTTAAASQCLHQIQEPAPAQAAPAAVAVPDSSNLAFAVEQRGDVWVVVDDAGGVCPASSYECALWNALTEARAALAATPAAAPDTLRNIAIEELAQLGYTFDGDKMMPPDFVGELMHVVQTAQCGCREGTCETKSDRACRMKTEIAAAAPVVLPEPDAVISEVMGLVDEWGMESHLRGEAELDAQHSEATQEEIDCAKDRATKERAAWKAIESKLRALLAGVSAPAAKGCIATLTVDSSGNIDYETAQAGWLLPEGVHPLYAAPQAQAFQQRVQPWMMACFGPEISADRSERNHRFLEEALELVQSCGCTASEAHQLVDYVYGRPWGEPAQEAGGVMVTLAALCLANDLDMHACAEAELARIWTKVEAIRAKQAAKPKHSPLPMHVTLADARDAGNGWQDISTLTTCDDLIWLYCQDTNTVDGPVAPSPIYEDSWTHWAYAEAPSTASIDRAAIAAAKGEDQ